MFKLGAMNIRLDKLDSLPAILSKAKTGIIEGYKHPRQCQFSFINMTLR